MINDDDYYNHSNDKILCGDSLRIQNRFTDINLIIIISY